MSIVRPSGIAITEGGSGYTGPTGFPVSITGGGGSGATATAFVSSGAVTNVRVDATGSGYTSPPSVDFSAGGGTGATAQVTVIDGRIPKGSATGGVDKVFRAGAPSSASAQTVTAIIVANGGSGYTSAPSVAITGGNGSGATATATLADGAVASIAVANGGSGYTSAPDVAITGGGGSGAAAIAQVARDAKEANAVYRLVHGDLVKVFAKPGLPQIASFTVSPDRAAQGASQGDLTLAFSVTGSTSNAIHRLSDTSNIPLSGNTSVDIAAPSADETYRLTSSNAEGAVVAEATFWRYRLPTIDSLRFGIVQAPLVGVVPRIAGSITMHPWQDPEIEFTGRHGFSSGAIARSMAHQSGDTRDFFAQGNPAGPEQSISDTFTLTVRLRIKGAYQGDAVERSVVGHW